MAVQIAGNQRNGQRSPTDDYPTDPQWTQALCDEVVFRGPVWECAAGSGQMVDVLQARGYEVTATDISEGADFLEETARWEGSIVTNPPYRLLDRFVHHALELAQEQVAMLLPIGALGGQRRYSSLWSVRPPVLLLVICSRMKVNDVPSQFNHVWAVWDCKRKTTTKLKWAL